MQLGFQCYSIFCSTKVASHCGKCLNDHSVSIKTKDLLSKAEPRMWLLLSVIPAELQHEAHHPDAVYLQYHWCHCVFVSGSWRRSRAEGLSEGCLKKWDSIEAEALLEQIRVIQMWSLQPRYCSSSLSDCRFCSCFILVCKQQKLFKVILILISNLASLTYIIPPFSHLCPTLEQPVICRCVCWCSCSSASAAFHWQLWWIQQRKELKLVRPPTESERRSFSETLVSWAGKILLSCCCFHSHSAPTHTQEATEETRGRTATAEAGQWHAGKCRISSGQSRKD